MTAVGFEPTRIAPRELESRALDRSAKLSCSLNLKTPRESLGQCHFQMNNSYNAR